MTSTAESIPVTTSGGRRKTLSSTKPRMSVTARPSVGGFFAPKNTTVTNGSLPFRTIKSREDALLDAMNNPTLTTKNLDDDVDMITALDKESLTKIQLQFMEAARINRCDVISMILEQKLVKINIRNNLDRTALHMAASQGSFEAVQMLVNAKAIVDVQDKHGMTPMFWAAFQDHVQIVLYLIGHGAQIGKKTKRGYTLLHVLAKSDAIKTMEAMVRGGGITDYNDVDLEGLTPLMLAIESKSLRVSTVLSRLGTIVEHIDRQERNVIHLAVIAKADQILAQLCKHQEVNQLINNPDIHQKAPIHYAMEDGNYECAFLLFRSGSFPNIKTKKAYAPLIIASQHGNVEMIQICLDFGAKINRPNYAGNTPLHVACIANNKEAVILLLKKGAKLSALNFRQQTPFNVAVEQGSTEAAEVLILAGAEIHQVDRTSKTPLVLAAQSGFLRIVDLIIKTDRWRARSPERVKETMKIYLPKRRLNSDNDSEGTGSDTETVIEGGLEAGGMDDEDYDEISQASTFIEGIDPIPIPGQRKSRQNGLKPERKDDKENSDESSQSISQASSYHSSEEEEDQITVLSNPKNKLKKQVNADIQLDPKQSPTSQTSSFWSETQTNINNYKMKDGRKISNKSIDESEFWSETQKNVDKEESEFWSETHKTFDKSATKESEFWSETCQLDKPKYKGKLNNSEATIDGMKVWSETSTGGLDEPNPDQTIWSYSEDDILAKNGKPVKESKWEQMKISDNSDNSLLFSESETVREKSLPTTKKRNDVREPDKLYKTETVRKKTLPTNKKRNDVREPDKLSKTKTAHGTSGIRNQLKGDTVTEESDLWSATETAHKTKLQTSGRNSVTDSEQSDLWSETQKSGPRGKNKDVMDDSLWSKTNKDQMDNQPDKTENDSIFSTTNKPERRKKRLDVIEDDSLWSKTNKSERTKKRPDDTENDSLWSQTNKSEIRKKRQDETEDDSLWSQTNKSERREKGPDNTEDDSLWSQTNKSERRKKGPDNTEDDSLWSQTKQSERRKKSPDDTEDNSLWSQTNKSERRKKGPDNTEDDSLWSQTNKSERRKKGPDSTEDDSLWSQTNKSERRKKGPDNTEDDSLWSQTNKSERRKKGPDNTEDDSLWSQTNKSERRKKGPDNTEDESLWSQTNKLERRNKRPDDTEDDSLWSQTNKSERRKKRPDDTEDDSLWSKTNKSEMRKKRPDDTENDSLWSKTDRVSRSNSVWSQTSKDDLRPDPYNDDNWSQTSKTGGITNNPDVANSLWSQVEEAKGKFKKKGGRSVISQISHMSRRLNLKKRKERSRKRKEKRKNQNQADSNQNNGDYLPLETVLEENEDVSQLNESTAIKYLPRQGEVSLLNYYQSYAGQYLSLFYFISNHKLHKNEWRQLADYWKFTNEQSDAIAIQDAGKSSAYRKHTYRMLGIWLHGLREEDNPSVLLVKAMTAIGKKIDSYDIQKDLFKATHGQRLLTRDLQNACKIS